MTISEKIEKKQEQIKQIDETINKAQKRRAQLIKEIDELRPLEIMGMIKAYKVTPQELRDLLEQNK